MNILLINLSTYVDKCVNKSSYIQEYVDTYVNKWIIKERLKNIDFIMKIINLHISFTAEKNEKMMLSTNNEHVVDKYGCIFFMWIYMCITFFT